MLIQHLIRVIADMYFLLLSDSPDMPDALTAVAAAERNAPRRLCRELKNTELDVRMNVQDAH